MRKFTSGYLWVIIFGLGALFQWWRESKVDFVIYGLIGFLLILALQEKIRIFSAKGPRFTFASWWLALSACIFMIAPIHSVASTVTALLLLPLLFSISWRPQDEDRAPMTPERLVTSRMWVSLAFLLSVSELGNYFWSDLTGSDAKFPTLTVLVDPIVASTAGRIGFVFIWALVGIELLKGSTKR
ncbi:MAG: hypothetical protein Q8L08_06060 [Candidatus Nanopelagicaceae bacterium]|nr:hypothetical protein [Candidatus Nanopelagicaceae bacterium]